MHPSGRRAKDSPLFDTYERVASHKKFVDMIHAGGTKIAFQATHSGSSAVSYQKSIGKKPFIWDTATEQEIHSIIMAYGDSALRAKQAGYDAIEIHAAHDSLLAQILSPTTNKRTDRWGGSVENRCRMHRQILKAVRKRGGEDFPVIIKIGVQDCLSHGLVFKEGLAAVKIMAEEGNIDAVEVSQGLTAPMDNGLDFNKTCMKQNIISIEQEAYFRAWTRQIKEAVGDKALVIMQGGLRTPSLMEDVIKNGEADLVSMCRPYVMEPHVVKRWKSGDMNKATCISCNKCVLAVYVENKPLECQLETNKKHN